MAYPQPRRYTWEEYLQLEAQSELRYEYFNGHVYCLAGAKTPHNEVASNCHDHLKRAARQQGCKAYLLEVKLFRRDGKRYFYPDGVVTCHPLDLQSKDGVRNPLIVVEVMSEGTRHRDQGLKLKEYLALDSLRHYLLIEQTYCLVQHYHRQVGGSWGFRNYDQFGQTIELPELALTLRVGDLYADIELGEAPALLQDPWAGYEASPMEAPQEES
jgi:Uma2 family endonuclease